MKYIIKLSAIILSVVFLVTSCNVDDKFQDPDSTTEGNVPAFFMGMINNERMRIEYYHVRTFIAEQTGRYAQTMIIGSSNGVYRQNDSYIGAFWKDFYVGRTGGDGTSGALAAYTMMKIQNQKDPIELQKDNRYFMNAAEVVLYDRGSQMIDLFGDIPFHSAMSLLYNGFNTDSQFEDQKALYVEMIDSLASKSEFFREAPSSTMFSTREILLGGDVNRWCRYANSIRLRMLLHMSDVDPAYAQPKILEILNDPARYPLIDGDNNPNYDPGKADVLLSPLVKYLETLDNALKEGNSRVAPDYLMNKLMVPSKDPRLPIMFNPTKKGEFVAASIDTPDETLSKLVNDTLTATWDSITYMLNRELPGIRVTAAEMNFIKAEAYERWGGDQAKAKQAYELAIRQSASFYWYLNSINARGTKEKRPTDDALTAFLKDEHIAYTTDRAKNLNLIATQKWLHLGWLQSIEAWTEYRRTKLPMLLPFPSDGKLSGYTQPPTRLTYPSAETANNKNYNKVRAKDTRTTRIFWDVR